MHVAHELDHLVERLGGRLDHDVDAVAEHVRGRSRSRAPPPRSGRRASRSRPVISQSIQTSRSVTRGEPTQGSQGRRSYSEPHAALGGLAARLVVGGVWIWAGAAQAARSRVERHRGPRVPAAAGLDVADGVGRALPMVEVVVGVCLVVGLLTRVSAASLGAAAGRVHHRHRLGLGARHLDQLRLLRRRRTRPRRDRQVPLGDRPRRGFARRCHCLVVWLRRTPLALDNADLSADRTEDRDVDEATVSRPRRARRRRPARAGGHERNRRLLITVAIVVVLSAVIAGVVIFSSGGASSPSTAGDRRRPRRRGRR